MAVPRFLHFERDVFHGSKTYICIRGCVSRKWTGNQCYAEYIGYEIMLLFEFDERSINSIFN